MAFGIRFFPLGVSTTTLTPNKYTNTNTFNTHSIRSVQSVRPSLFTNTQNFFTPAVMLDNPLAAPFLINGSEFFAPHVSVRHDQGRTFTKERRKMWAVKLPVLSRFGR